MLGKILLVLMLAQTQAGQGNQVNPNGSIHGQILIPLVRAADPIKVTLQKSDGPIVQTIFSDTQGYFSFRGLTAGSYEIVASVEGFEDVRQQVGVGNGFFGNVTVSIPLRENEKIIVIKPDGGAADDLVDIAELGRNYPKKAVQDYEKALEEIRKGNPGKATELLVSALKLAPDFYAAHNTLGTVYQRMSRYRDSEAEYRKARQLSPRLADPLVNLGSLFVEEAEARANEGEGVVGKILDNALDILEESLKLKRSALAYYFLGTAYYRSAFYEEAETNLKHALDMDPRPPAVRLMLANLYIKQKKWPNALEHLDAYLAENPKATGRGQVEDTRSKVAERVK
jgi:Tfp pilus assembly protein PilF